MFSSWLLIMFFLVPHCYMISFFKSTRTVKQPRLSVDSVEVPHLNDEAKHRGTKIPFKSGGFFAFEFDIDEGVQILQNQLSEDFNAVEVMHTLTTTSLHDSKKKPVEESHFSDSVEVSRKAKHQETDKFSSKSVLFSFENVNEMVQNKLAEDFGAVQLLPTPATKSQSLHNPEKETIKESEVPYSDDDSSNYLGNSAYDVVLTVHVNKAQLQQIEESLSKQAINFSVNTNNEAEHYQETEGSIPKSANIKPSNGNRRVLHQPSQKLRAIQHQTAPVTIVNDHTKANKIHGGLFLKGDDNKVVFRVIDAIPGLNLDSTDEPINLVSPVEFLSDSPPQPSPYNPTLTASPQPSVGEVPSSQPPPVFGNNKGLRRLYRIKKKLSSRKKLSSTTSPHQNIQQISYHATQESLSPSGQGLQPAPVVETRRLNKLKDFYSKSVFEVPNSVRKSPTVSSQVRVIDWAKYEEHSNEWVHNTRARWGIERGVGHYFR